MTRTKTDRFSPSLAQLEPRDVPVGNVTATLVEGWFGTMLQVTGDEAGNNVVLRGGGPGVVEVQGVDTTLNGGTAKLTFTGVTLLRVDVADGNDTVTGKNLAVAGVEVYAGRGDDTVRLDGTTGGTFSWGGVGLGLYVYGDYSQQVPDEGNGEDTIVVTNTRVAGDNINFVIVGDWGEEARRDTITVSNTTIGAGEIGAGFGLYIESGAYGPGAGDDITLDGLNMAADVPVAGWGVYVFDSPGDDRIRIRSWDIQVHTAEGAFGDFFVGGASGGSDTVEVENMNIAALVPAGVAFNQVALGVTADRVRVSNFRMEGGGSDGDFILGSFLGMNAADADLRNVEITSAAGFANLIMNSAFDDPTSDTSFTLANVTVRGSDGYSFTDFYTADGNDSIRATNCEFGRLSATLGEGDDRLTFVNVDFSAPHFVYPWGEFGGILTGGGDDAVSFTNCEGETVYLDTGDGDDAVNVTNCVFVTADLFGGDGDDDLNLTNCDGLFDLDGFEL